MKTVRTLSFLGAVWLAVSAAGCVSQSEFDQLRNDYMQLKEELNQWARDPGNDPIYYSVVEWQAWTKNVICDIKAKNTPDQAPYTSGPGETTERYCDVQDPNGVPEDPPEFGA